MPRRSWPNFNNKLKFDERSLPPMSGVNLAFYGYLKQLNNKDARLRALLWIDQYTGEVNEVMFFFYQDILLSVPPRCFTLFKDILKKTVKFKLSVGMFDSHNTKEYVKINPEVGLYYELNIDFPAPAEREPDFLEVSAEK